MRPTLRDLGIAAMERADKLRRLNLFRRSLPHVSASALSAILEEVARTGLPDMRSRHSLHEATVAEISADTPYGSLLMSVPLVRSCGAHTSMLVVNPFAMLSRAASSVGFATLLQRRFNEVPCTPDNPWRIVLYSDEVVPGNQLSNDNKRKLWVVYWSFLELGPEALAREDAWFCMAAQRSSDVAKVAAGMSQVFGVMIKLFFGSAVHDFSTGGVVIRSPSGNMARIFAKLGMILQDGAAHKSVWHCKGDAGTKICMLCLNLYTRKSEIVDEDGEHLLTCTLVQESELHFATDADVRGSVRRLASKQLTEPPKLFDRWQQAVGFRHEPHNLLLDPGLDDVVMPVSQFCHDWMHAIMVHGIFNTVTFLMLEAMIANGHRDIWDMLRGYVALWTWPARIGGAGLNDVFQPKRASASRRAKLFKATASEGLSLYSVMAYFVKTVILPSGLAVCECKAFLAMASVIDLLSAIPLGVTSPAQLATAIKTFLEKCIEADWQAYMHPKFHWMVHLPKHLERFNCLPTCWVHERKHRMVKRYATEICNTVTYERSILGEVCSHHLAELAKPDVFSFEGLVKPRPAPPRVHELLTSELELPVGEQVLYSHEARCSSFEPCSKGDVVLLEHGGQVVAGQVWFHAAAMGIQISMVSLWSRNSLRPDCEAAEWLIEQRPTLVFGSDILSCVAHTTCRPGVCRTLIPVHVRSRML